MANLRRIDGLLRASLFVLIFFASSLSGAQGDFVELRTAMEVDVDGAPNAYGPPTCHALDNERNAHRNGRPDGETVGYVVKDGMPVVQGPEDPAPGCFVSTSAFTDLNNHNEGDSRRYLDASKVNYVVLGRFAKDHGVKLGDLVAVSSSKTKKSVFGIVGDSGNPSGSEGSLALLQALGYPVHDGRSGSVSHKEITIRYFPGSNPNREFLNTQGKIDARARALGLGHFGSQ